MGVLIEEDTLDWRHQTTSPCSHADEGPYPLALGSYGIEKSNMHERSSLESWRGAGLGMLSSHRVRPPWHGEHMIPTKNLVNLDIREQQESHRVQLQMKGLQAIKPRSQDVE
jgi:hypothetical protein